MKTRLTEWMRREICKRLMSKAFDEEEQKLVKTSRERGDVIYRLMYPDWKKMDEAPAQWFDTVDAIRIWYRHGSETVMFGEERRVWARQPKPPKQAIKLMLMNKREAEDFRARKLEAQREIERKLSSYATIEKLVEGWPSVKPYIPKDLAVAAKKPVSTVELDRKLGLVK